MSETKFPPAGTMCSDCGCCQANVYAGEDTLCWACDAGSHPRVLRVHKPAAPISIPPIRLEPVERIKCEEKQVNEQQQSKGRRGGRTSRTPDEIRAKILAEPASVSNCEVARRCGVSEPTARTIRLAAGMRSTACRGKRTAPSAPKPEQEIRHPKKQILRSAQDTNGHAAALASIPTASSKVSITVHIDEASADQYWHRLTLDQKAATIELQMQAIVDCRIGARA
jgi:hypothetical protein